MPIKYGAYLKCVADRRLMSNTVLFSLEMYKKKLNLNLMIDFLLIYVREKN